MKKSYGTLSEGAIFLAIPVDVANGFNKYFSNIPNNLVNNLPSVCNKYTDYVQLLNFSSMFMSPTNSSEFERIIALAKSKLSADLDQISSIVLKHLSQNALEVLSHIFNQSLLIVVNL